MRGGREHNKSYIDLVNLFHARGLSRILAILTSFDFSMKRSVINIRDL